MNQVDHFVHIITSISYHKNKLRCTNSVLHKFLITDLDIHRQMFLTIFLSRSWVLNFTDTGYASVQKMF